MTVLLPLAVVISGEQQTDVVRGRREFLPLHLLARYFSKVHIAALGRDDADPRIAFDSIVRCRTSNSGHRSVRIGSALCHVWTATQLRCAR